MTLPADLQAIVGSLQWNFVYNLIILLAIEAALAIAYGHWKRSKKRDAQRLVLAMAVLLGVRFIPLLLSLLSSAGFVDPSAVLPPLERALNIISLAIIAWAFAFAAESVRGAAAPFLWTNVGLATLAYVSLARLWTLELATNPQLLYTNSWQHYLWAIWQILICLGAGYALIRGAPKSRQAGTLLALFSLAVVGQILSIILPMTATLSFWERLTNLLIFPLMAVVTYQIAIEQSDIVEPQVLPFSAGTDNVTELLLTLFQDTATKKADAEEDTRSEAEPQPQFAKMVVMPTARALGVDQVAIGLLEGEQGDRMRLVAIYNPLRQGRGGEVVSFPLDEQLAIQRSLRRQEMVLVGGADDIVQLKFLYALMGSNETGPLLVHPLLYRGSAIGVLIAGNGSSKQAISYATTQLAPQLTSFMAELLVGPQLIRKLEKTLHEKEQQLTSQGEEWGKRLETLDKDLHQERENAQLFAERMADLERANKSKEAELDRLSRRLLLQEETARRSQQEASALSKRLETLARAKVGLEDEISGYREQINDLEQLLRKGEEHPYKRG